MSKFYNEIVKSLRIRKVEVKLLELFNEGLINGTVHTCVGQELVGVFVAKNLLDSDFVVSNHRGHGHYIAKTDDTEGLLAELMGLKKGCSGGVGGSQHIYNKNYLSNGIQGGMVPIASGIALSMKIEGQKSIALAYIGDGTLGQGVLYEAMHLAGIYSLPLVIVLENNGYSQSTSHKDNFFGSIEKRADGFGFKYYETSTFDLDNLDENISSAISYARDEQKPVFIHVSTYRLNSHSKGDDNRFDSEIRNFIGKDILNNIDDKLFSEEIKNIDSEINSILESLISEEKLITFPKIERVLNKEVYFSSVMPSSDDGNRINEIIYMTLKDILDNENVIILGEDICNRSEHTECPYGGAFKVTKDLSDLYPNRVLNTSISEAGIVGLGTGAALTGRISIIEIMFGDFCTLIIDQLQQHACKFGYMYGKEIKVPLIIRTPMGGRRGYGPTHSQSIEALFNNILGLDVFALNSRISPRDIYVILLNRVSKPSVVIENKVLYTKKLNNKSILGYDLLKSNDEYPMFRLKPRGCACATLFCYGNILDEVEIIIDKLFYEHEILIDVICPTQIKPLNIAPFYNSVSKTSKLIVIEEGNINGGFGSNLAVELSQLNSIFCSLFIGSESIIPSSIQAEMSVLPTSDSIYNSIVGFCKE